MVKKDLCSRDEEGGWVNVKILIGISLIVLLGHALVQAFWRGKKDNKSVAELELMNDWELCNEAMHICPDTTIEGKRDPAFLLEGLDYLKTIQRVARKKHNGATPEWANEFIRAVLDKDADRCVPIFRGFCCPLPNSECKEEFRQPRKGVPDNK